jgi:hypothetical protein
MGVAAGVRVYLIASKVTGAAAVERAVRDLGPSGAWEITP